MTKIGEKFENNSTFKDEVLKVHLSQLATTYRYEQQSLDIHHEIKQQTSPKKKRTDTKYLEESLIYGIGMMNLWNVSIDKSIRPFLETLGSCFTRTECGCSLILNVTYLTSIYLLIHPSFSGVLACSTF